MTGNNYLNGGTVSVNSLAELAGGSLVMNNGTLSYTGSGETSSRSVVLAGLGGTFDIEGSATVTQTMSIPQWWRRHSCLQRRHTQPGRLGRVDQVGQRHAGPGHQ